MSKMFPGLTSLWRTLLKCMQWSAKTSYRNMNFAWFSVNLSMYFWSLLRLPPSQCSITIMIYFCVSNISKHFTTFLWLSLRSIVASCIILFLWFSSLIRFLLMVLMATGRDVSLWVASATFANPPLPISFMKLYSYGLESATSKYFS